MTELEIMQRAKLYMDKLAQGIDPISDREVPEDSVLNQVRLARCFFYVSDVLGQVIANGGSVGAKPKEKLPEFSVTPDQLARIRVSQEPLRVTEFVQLIHESLGEPNMKKPKTTLITNWLVQEGFLEKQTLPDGKTRRVPTAMGERIGLFLRVRQGQYGEYQAVLYSPEAQQFVLDHFMAVLGQ